MSAPICIHRDGWSCIRCRSETLPAPVTDHETVEDLEVEALKAEVVALKSERDRYRDHLETVADIDCHEGCASIAIEALRGRP